MKTKLFTCIVLTLMSIPSFAQSSQKTVLELMVKSGTTAQIKQFDDILNAKIKENKSAFENEEIYKKFVSVMSAELNSKNGEKYFIEYFALYTKEDSLKKIISIYNSPLLAEITKVELESTDPSKQQEMMAFTQSLKNTPPSQERIQQLVTLNNVLGSSEITVRILKNMVKSMAKGINSSLPKEQQMSLSELEQKTASAFPANFTQQMQNQIITISLFTYKGVSNDKLNNYINIWKSPIGQYFIKENFKAFDYAFSKMGENIGSSFKIF
ncbi:MAG: hypothetical protein PHS30_02090 [Bacteroidales bacterium]|nr:hypothetical protein [Bacteroidales bacterium]